MSKRDHRPLLLVSAGLGLAGGGSALLGRLCARALAARAADRGAAFDAFSLGLGPEILLGCDVRTFGANHSAMASAVVGRQLGPRRPLIVFDHLGPARAQALLPAALRSPYAVFLLGIECWRPLSFDRRRALRGAGARLAISDHTRRRALEFTPSLPPMDVLPLALEDRQPEGQADEELLGRAGEDFFLIVGRMSEAERYKGHDELLDALPTVRERFGPVRLVVAGGGNDRRRLEARARESGLEGAVLFTGFVDEATLAELYRRCRAFVMPSRDEGFGLVYLEAMKAAKPCIAARGSAAEEVVVDGRTGLLVDREDRQELIAALGRLWSDSSSAEELGRAGADRFRETFAFDAFAARLGHHLDRLEAHGA